MKMELNCIGASISIGKMTLDVQASEMIAKHGHRAMQHMADDIQDACALAMYKPLNSISACCAASNDIVPSRRISFSHDAERMTNAAI
ncbi:MAG: hypothetical protein ABI395_09245 [Sphingobium sp.]